MVEFKISEYGNGDNIMLVRQETRKDIIEGLPPTHSQTILMQVNEMNDLIQRLNDYANERRSQTV